MKKVFVSLGIVFLISIIAASAFIITQGGKRISQRTATPTPTNLQQTAVTLAPQSLTVQAGQLATVQVMIQNQQSAPAIVQLELTYDPTALTNVTVVPGNFFSQPNILFARINQSVGRISYVLQTNNATSPLNPTGPVAIISFVPSAYATNAQTHMSFLPKSVVKDRDNNNVLNGMYGATITLSTGGFAIPSPTAIQTTLPTVPFQPTMTSNPLSPPPTLSY